MNQPIGYPSDPGWSTIRAMAIEQENRIPDYEDRRRSMAQVVDLATHKSIRRSLVRDCSLYMFHENSYQENVLESFTFRSKDKIHKPWGMDIFTNISFERLEVLPPLSYENGKKLILFPDTILTFHMMIVKKYGTNLINIRDISI